MTLARCLHLRVRNADQVQGDLALLSQAAQASAQLRQLLLNLGDLSKQLRFVQCKDLPAVSAVQANYDLEFSDALAGVLSAVRAGNFNA